CVRAIRPSQLDYASLRGLPALREAIAEQVRSRGTTCDATQIIVTAGAQRALDLVFHLLLDPGDCVLMEEPGYPGARSAFAATGANILPMPVDGDGIDIESRAHDIRNARLAYVTPSHQFPLGMAMSLERRRSLLAWASASRAWIVEDDYDCDF